MFFLMPFSFIIIALFLAIQYKKQPPSRWIKYAMLYLMLACMIGQFDFLRYPLTLRPQTDAYRQEYGNKRIVVWYHWHDMFHYYMGAKYFPEIGYTGLYETVALADREFNPPRITGPTIRELRDPRIYKPVQEGADLASKLYRPKFTDERWEQFKKDLNALEMLEDSHIINGAVNDVGYNPPPTWTILGHLFTSLIPVTEEKAWFGDLDPHWYQAFWPPMVDVCFLIATMTFIYFTFGFQPLFAFVVLFTVNFNANYNWTSGSFLRYTWVCEVMVGACFLKRKQYIPAGIFMTLAGFDRIFPLGFLAGACIPLGWAFLFKKEARKPALQFGISVFVTTCLWVGLSIALFGVEAWHGFFEKITIHKNMIFNHNMGYARLAEFRFDQLEDLQHQIGWQKWIPMQKENMQKYIVLHRCVQLLVIGLAGLAVLRRPAYEAALLFGGTVFFMTQNVTAYYYIFMAIIGVVICTGDRSNIYYLKLTAIFLWQASTWLLGPFVEGGLKEQYYINWSTFVFFLTWIGICLYESFGKPKEKETIALPNPQPVQTV